MAIELRLEKSGGGPWGFKLTGGADLEIPLTVVKISDGGPAHKAGLQIGDVILKVNESDLADLPHSKAQETIGNSGEILVLIIYRGELNGHQSTLIADEQSNDEVHKIMVGSIPIDYPERPYIEEEMSQQAEINHCEIEHDLNLTDEEIRSIIHPEIVETNKSASQNEQHTIELQEHKEMMYESSERESVKVEYQKMRHQEYIDSIHQNSINGGSEVQVKHEEIENIANQIVDKMSKIQRQQEEEVMSMTETSGQIVDRMSKIQQKQEEEVMGMMETSGQIVDRMSKIQQRQEEEVVGMRETSGQIVDRMSKIQQRREEEVMGMMETSGQIVDRMSKIQQRQDEEVMSMMETSGQIVDRMSKIQQRQGEDVMNMTETAVEEVSRSGENNQEAVIWQSQVVVEQTHVVQQSEVLKAVSGYLSDMEMERRKWSTFLQKPKCSKPVSKFVEEPKKSTYKVVIRTKKDLEAAKKAAEEAAIKEAEEAARAEEEAARAAEETARAEERAARAAEEAERVAFEEAEARLLAEYEMEQRELDENENVLESEIREEDDERSRSEATSKHMSGKDAVVTVEQQLAQVKEQLLALSELPSTIQMTLSIITEQLQKLAQEAQPLTEDDIRDDELSNADTDTEDEITELLVLESQEALSVVEEESEYIRTNSALEREAMQEKIIDEEAEARRLVEEEEKAEARRLEEERVAKKEKEKMQRQPLTPLERPIILPGGRRWAQPDDAVRSVRQPKLSDDKIDETISSYYEVITGKTIGINFLKYQPPPKNLDHLHQSEVYKMVHDLEPPPRGITARAEKIPAVQDYLVKVDQDTKTER